MDFGAEITLQNPLAQSTMHRAPCVRGKPSIVVLTRCKIRLAKYKNKEHAGKVLFCGQTVSGGRLFGMVVDEMDNGNLRRNPAAKNLWKLVKHIITNEIL